VSTQASVDRPIGYVCDWLPPDFGAVGQYATEFARVYAERDGRDVVLIGLTSGQPGTSVEALGKGTLTTVRLAADPVPKSNLRQRLLWTLRSNARLARSVAKHLPSGSEVTFTGSPPFLIFLMIPLRRLRGYRLTYRITDFHPECLMASMERAPAGLRMLHRATVALRRRIDRFEVLGEDQRRLLDRMGIMPDRIVLKRDPSPVTITSDTRPLALPEGAADHVLLLYSGNFGVAHDVDTFVRGYVAHHRRGSGRVMLWLNAVGAGAEEVAARLEQAGCPLIRGRPVPLSDLASLLVTPHAHLVTLKDAFVGLVLPSKIYGCVASGRDILFIGSAESDVHRVATGRKSPSQAYARVDVGDDEGVFRELEALGQRAATSREPSRRSFGLQVVRSVVSA
jgi:hypothetical protein